MSNNINWKIITLALQSILSKHFSSQMIQNSGIKKSSKEVLQLWQNNFITRVVEHNFYEGGRTKFALQ